MKNVKKYKGLMLKTLFCFLIFPLSAPAYALTPDEILKDAMEQKGMQNFSGISRTLSFIKSKKFATDTRVFFRRPGMCRMEGMGGMAPNRFLITRNNEILNIDPRQRKVYRTKVTTSSEKRTDKEVLLLKNYSASLKGEENVAGRSSYVIEVASNFRGRPRKVLWIDKQNFTILSSNTYTPDGSLKISVLFKEVDFGDEPSKDSFTIPAGFKVVDVEQKDRQSESAKELSDKIGLQVKLPEKLPDGFVLDGFFSYHCNCGVEMAHIRYFDGLAGISIFEGPKDCPKCREGFSWRRAMGVRGNDRCATGECELTEQKWETVRTFFDDTRRFIVVSDISNSEIDIIESELLKK